MSVCKTGIWNVTHPLFAEIFKSRQRWQTTCLVVCHLVRNGRKDFKVHWVWTSAHNQVNTFY